MDLMVFQMNASGIFKDVHWNIQHIYSITIFVYQILKIHQK
jgi:hypothetical protein